MKRNSPSNRSVFFVCVCVCVCVFRSVFFRPAARVPKDGEPSLSGAAAFDRRHSASFLRADPSSLRTNGYVCQLIRYHFGLAGSKQLPRDPICLPSSRRTKSLFQQPTYSWPTNQRGAPFEGSSLLYRSTRSLVESAR